MANFYVEKLEGRDLVMVEVDSSNILAVGYDAPARDLYLKFHSGEIYKYAKVPLNVHIDLMMADSMGSFFYKKIRDKYDTEKMKVVGKSQKV